MAASARNLKIRRFNIKIPLRRQEALTGLAIAALPLMGFAVFYFIPFGITIRNTLTSGGGSFVGFRNYVDVFGSAAFRLAAVNTLKFIGVGVPCLLALSLCAALLLNRSLKGSGGFRTALVLPIVLPTASVIMAFRILFDDGGAINFALHRLGLPSISFLHSDKMFWVLLTLFLWKNMGYAVIIMASGLTQIPREYYDAAKADGADWFYVLRKITLPLMSPTIMFATVFGIMFAFKAFREAYALAGDYPDTSIYMLQHFMKNNFANLNYARLSVAAVMTFLVIFALVWLLFWRRFKEGAD
jgi:multiple sugar transport system permease protein